MRFSGTEQVIFGSNVLFLGEKHPFLGKVLSFWKRRMQGVTEQLKAENQMLWVEKMNNIIACAEEIMVREVVYV